MAGKLFRNLTFWVFVAGMAGYGLAWFSGDPGWVEMTNPPVFYEFIQLIKTTFLALLKMLVAPIIFFSLIGGLLHIGDAARLRSLGSITLLYYIGTTCIAICIGLVVVFFIHPWVGNVEQITVDRVAEGAYVQPALYIAQSSGSFVQVMQGLLSTAFTNPFTALAQLNILAIATNAFMLGLAMLLVVPQSSPLVTCVHHMNDLLHKVLSWVLYTMPFGIFAIIFDVTLKSGGTLLSSLLGFCAVVVGGTLVHGLIVLPLIGKIFAGMDVLHFFSKAAKPLMVAFATSSSSATLPVSMQTAEEELGVSDTVSSFVFPLGATMNMDGTALYEGIAAVFLAYLFGIDLSTTGMFVVFFMAMLSSIGAPGMPSGSMAGMQMVLLGAGIPLEAIGILLVVERPLDTIRTAVNVEGDMIGALVTQRYFNKA
jgi:Na+/H+-dicarboxylate symporter